MTIAVVFPGQGSQHVGMGLALATERPEARDVFDVVDRAVGDAPPLSALCFEGPEASLTLTRNAQPAILAASVAAWRALRARAPSLAPAFFAGHSLGEYSALVATGALDLASAARLLRVRGDAMQSAVAPGVGAMAALMLVDVATAGAICDEARQELPGRVVSLANFNSPGQIVVAGHADAVARVCALADAHRGKAMMLKVSAPFHCALMAPAAEALDAALRAVTFGPFAAPVVANVDAAPNADPSRVRDLLVRQVAGTVRWSECVEAMVAAGVTTFLEVGPGRVLAGLIKRIHKPATVLSVSDPATLDAAVSALAAQGVT